MNMVNAEHIIFLMRKRRFLLHRLKLTSKQLYKYQMSRQQNKALLMSYRKSVDELWSSFKVVQEELELFDEEENSCLETILHFYHALDTQLTELIDST